MSILSLFFGSLVGYKFQNILNHPNSKVYNKLPNIKIKFIQVSPNIKLFIGKKEIHIHHWLTYSVVLIITVTIGSVALLETAAAKGLLAGSIAQGLSFPDWKKIIKDKKIEEKTLV